MAENTYQRNMSGDSKDDFSYFLTSELPTNVVYNMLKLKKLSESEIDSTIDKLKTQRQKIKKVVNKFMRKLQSKYSHIEDKKELLMKGLKHADKYGLSDAQKDVFKKMVMRGAQYSHYAYQNEVSDTQMGKFLGITHTHGTQIRLPSKDYAKLNDIKSLYDATRQLHMDVQSQHYTYKDCDPTAINGTYNKDKHMLNVHIHPLIAALYLPKEEYMERRTLMTNVGRMVLSRAQAYLEKPDFHLNPNVTMQELDADLELAYDISTDPNSLSSLVDANPMDNLVKRFNCQIELYKVVLNLRNGRYYARSHDDDDGIRSLERLCDSYEWSFLDSPDMYSSRDEGTFLRKLLSVFSIRPTVVQLQSFSTRFALNAAPVSAVEKTKFMNIPIVNVKLPVDVLGKAQSSIHLGKSLNQSDYFIENRQIVPKNKSTIFSRRVAFFYCNRRFPSINFTTERCVSLRTVSLPTSYINTISINTTPLVFENKLRIGKDFFNLRSVVMINRSVAKGFEFASGCSAVVLTNEHSSSGDTTHLYYNPTQAGKTFLDKSINKYVTNDPISVIDELGSDDDGINFRHEAQVRGVVYYFTLC
jgi:hypothetical protein